MLAKAFCCLGTGLFSGRQAKMVGKPTVVAGATTTIPIPGNEFRLRTTLKSMKELAENTIYDILIPSNIITW